MEESLISVPLGILQWLNLGLTRSFKIKYEYGTSHSSTSLNRVSYHTTEWSQCSVTPLESSPDRCLKGSVEFYKARDVQSNKRPATAAAARARKCTPEKGIAMQ